MNRYSEVFRSESGWRSFFLSVATLGLSYGLYKGILDNYLAEIVAMSEFDRGVTEFFRELPGLLLVFLLAVLYKFSAEKIYNIGAAVMLVGMVMQSCIPASRILATVAIFIYSLGEHIQLGMRNTLSLEYAKEGHGGAALGLQNAVNHIGTLAGYLLVIAVLFFMPGNMTTYRIIFAASAFIILIG